MNGLDSIWNSLRQGDPGPAVALIDALMDNDFAAAAGGVLSDLAERMLDAHEVIEDENERSQFVSAIEEVLRHALPDTHDYDAFITEVRS